MKGNWKLWLGLVISLGLFAWVLDGLSLEEAWQGLTRVDYRFFVPAVTVYFASVWVRAWRWQYLLRPVGCVSLTRLFRISVIGYMGNNIYPARAGEVVRAYVLRRSTGVPMSTSLATILVERVLDGLVMLLILLGVLALRVDLPDRLRGAVLLAAALFLIATALLVAAALRPRRFLALYGRVEGRLPAAVRRRTHGTADRFFDGLIALGNGRGAATVLLASVAVWAVEALKYWVLMLGFPFAVPLHVLLVMVAVVNLATIVPAAPGYAGTFDAAGIMTLVAFGVPEPTAAGYTVVLHAILLVPVTLLGLYYVWRERLGWRSLTGAPPDPESRRAAEPQRATER